MENSYQDLTRQILKARSSSRKSRFLVAVAGAPGSGKTTIAGEVVKLLNSPRQEEAQSRLPGTDSTITAVGIEPQAVAISMDGFHLPRAILDRLPNREEAYARRGAPWTFDVKGILKLVKQLRDSFGTAADSSGPISAPSFDHATKDPVPDAVVISNQASIIILEGNYLLLDEEDWREVSQLVDLRIFIDVDPAEARKRVARRHVHSGIETSLADGERRFDQNDGINGDLIRDKMIAPDVIVKSVTERFLY